MKRPEKLLYQVNKLSYGLILLHIACIVFYITTVLSKMTIGYQIAFVSLANIIMMLFAFLTAVKIKVYDHKFQYAPFIMAVVVLLQLINLPKGLDEITTRNALIAGSLAILFAILSSLVSIYKNKIRAHYIDQKKIKKSHLAN